MGIIITESSLITDDVETKERLQKEKEYFAYIQKHVSCVVDAFNRYFLPLLDKTNICSTVPDEELKQAIRVCGERIAEHDHVKYGDAEFDSYRAKYYPTANEKKGDAAYQQLVEDRLKEAFKHHYANNPHHPEYWVDSETGLPRDMSLDAIVEMISDWTGVSTMFGGTVVDWYKHNAVHDEQKAMTQRTRDIVEDLMYNVLFK